jgi:hypothetical protein
MTDSSAEQTLTIRVVVQSQRMAALSPMQTFVLGAANSRSEPIADLILIIIDDGFVPGADSGESSMGARL